MTKTLVIDNYDSFTYNIVQYFGELQQDIRVWHNDEISIDELKALAPDAIVIGPGPCDPDRAGISLEVIETFKGIIPILGICLGHQAIGQAFGGKTFKLKFGHHGGNHPIRAPSGDRQRAFPRWGVGHPRSRWA